MKSIAIAIVLSSCIIANALSGTLYAYLYMPAVVALGILFLVSIFKKD